MNKNDVSKQLNAAFQTLKIDEAGTDCRSKRTLDIILEPYMKNLFEYRYIKEGNELVLLEGEKLDEMVGKLIHVRSPLFCTNDVICNKCAGELYYKLGISNTGLLTARIGSSLLNSALKKFHNTTIHYGTIDIDDYIKG